ncbi:MAG: Type 1 glutamine amidotransferase-like domain-containing protein [Candidatus Zambryskibacteria bacterium]|nr:Type 1 glutamine amidotransferase-like domain-containing protein [Candidatus Zambryskibacteria bacterium]
MSTRFILQGGFPKDGKQENDAFFREILSTAPQEAKILLVLFSKEADRVEKNTKEDIEQFVKNGGGRRLTFEVATEDKFIEEIRNSDVVYLHGGNTGKLLETLRKFPEFSKSIEGKIIGADSAGVNILCAAFFSLSLGVGEGLGVLPIKVLCHYKEENKDKLNMISPELETVSLPELTFKVFEM